MTESTINAKGQTTVPADIRKSIGGTPGTRLVWHVLSDGRLFVRVKNKSLDASNMLTPPKGKTTIPAEEHSVTELKGMFGKPKKKTVSIKAMNAAIAECGTGALHDAGRSKTVHEGTRKAIAELEAGKGKRFASVDALMVDLHADD